MAMVHRIAAIGLLAGTVGAAVADKQPVPSKTDQEPIRIRLRTLFKAEYSKTDKSTANALAEKLVERAAEEKENPAVRYVMLSEAMAFATKGGEIEFAIRAARQIDKDFNDPELKDSLAAMFTEHLGGKDRLDDFRQLAAEEIALPTASTSQAELGEKWLSVAKSIRADTRLPILRRSRFWFSKAMSASDNKGLARTEAEKGCQEATTEIDKADARNSRFTLYAGKWIVKYENKYTHEYVIKTDGSLAFDRCISPDGTVFVKKEEQKAKLVRRNGTVIVPFADGTIIERFSLNGEKLVVERFYPSSDYPKSPSNKGEGVREK
jgi:hypothetical protein